MSTITEGTSRLLTQVTPSPLTIVRQFTIDQVSVRLASEAGLVSRYWDQIVKSEGQRPPDVTILYCSVGWRGEIYSVIEFVAGETLEEFVKRSDPAVCEQEIPLFCRLLDAFEGAGPKSSPKPPRSTEIQLLDFGVMRAACAVSPKAHGALLAAHDGTWSEAVFGESNQVRPLLMELSGKLPGGFQYPDQSGNPKVGDCIVTSLSSPVPVAELAVTVPLPQEAAPKKLAKNPASSYAIGIGTTVLVLGMFWGVGGFLAKRSVPANAGKLNLPPIVETAPEAQSAPLTLDPPPETAATPAIAASPKKEPKPPTGRIVLARGARPLVQTKLQYPPDARKEHRSGVVEMQLTIAEDGSVRSPRVLSGDPLLSAGLAEQISKWVYQPLKVNGKPVPMTTELAVRFELNQ